MKRSRASGESFVYCITCRVNVTDPSKPCLHCNSTENMVDWPEPEADCTKLDNNEMDCLERGDIQPCAECAEWLKWENARERTEEIPK